MSSKYPDFSLAFLSLADVEPIEMAKIASMCGYKMMGVRLLPATIDEPPYRILTDKKYRKDFISVLADTGIKVADVEIIRLNRDTNINEYRNFFDCCSEIGATNVVVVGDDLNSIRLSENFSKLCELAISYGLWMNLEAIPWTEIKDLQVALDVVKKANHTNAVVLVDAYHFSRRKTPIEVLNLVTPDISNIFQICDGSSIFDTASEAIRIAARTARLVPGEGEIDLLSMISKIPRTTIVSIEVPSRFLMTMFSPLERARHLLDATKLVYDKSDYCR